MKAAAASTPHWGAKMSINRLVVRLLAVAGAALLASCASAPATTSADNEIDYAKMAQIERAARVFGTQVIWINLPTKRTDATK